MSEAVSNQLEKKIFTSLATGDADDATLRELMEVRRQDVPYPLENTMLMALSDTNNAKLRNALAIGLAAIDSRDAVGRLIQLLTESKTSGARATLLYALQKLQASPHLALLARLISFDTPETREEAFELLEKNAPAASIDARHSAMQSLLDWLPSISDQDRIDIILDAVDVLMQEGAN